jgi:putative sterol carrier protein
MPSTPQEVFDAMPKAFLPLKAGAAELVIGFNLSGDQGGTWAVEIKDGVCQTRRAEPANPVATIRTSDQDFMALFSGQLNAVAAYMSGRVKVDGNVTAIMNLLSYFDMRPV